MRPTVFIKLLFAILALSGLVACDILSPRTKPIEDQLKYVHSAKRNMQALHRWWILLAPDPVSSSPALGQLPFYIPATFSTSATKTSDLGALNFEPESWQCDVTCTIFWQVELSPPPQSRYLSGNVLVGADTHVSSGTFLVDADTSNATWKMLLGRDATVTEVTLDNQQAGQFADWHWQMKPTEHVAFALRAGIEGTWKITESLQTAHADLAPWSDLFFWDARPLSVAKSAAPDMQEHVVQYANGLSSYTRWQPGHAKWQHSGPGIAEAQTQILANGAIQYEITYLPEQSLGLVTTVIERLPAIGSLQSFSITEQHISRLGTRKLFLVKGVRTESDGFRLQWRENDTQVGTIDIQSTDLGWRIEGFWDSVFGDLVEVNIDAFSFGIWIGDFTGWDIDDFDQPSESGDFTMLPDGTLEAEVLFRQVNDESVVVPVISPPEGASRVAVE